ncbi:MAG: DUF4349 domain-containing protein [Cellulosilyticaceae bacterium]
MRRIKIIVVLCVIIISVIGCGSKRESDISSQQTQMNTVESIKEEAESEMGLKDEAPNLDESEKEKGRGVEVTLNNNLNRKVIKRGDIVMETKDFEGTMALLLKEIERLGGFTESSTIHGISLYDKEQGYKRADLVIRIPEKIFDDFINGSSKFGNVVSKSVQGEDITNTYVDTKARLKSLTIQRERLMALLEKSGSLEELFSIEKELGNVSYEIEKYQGTLNQYDALVDFSTITISLEEVATYQDIKNPVTLSERLQKTFINSWKKVARFSENCILFVIGSIPYLIIGLPIILIIIWGIRRFKIRSIIRKNK